MMSGRKRGHYFKYLCAENESLAKIPRQTEWNRRRKVFYKFDQSKFSFVLQNLNENINQNEIKRIFSF